MSKKGCVMKTETLVSIFGLTKEQEHDLRVVMENPAASDYKDNKIFHLDNQAAQLVLFDPLVMATLPSTSHWKDYDVEDSEDASKKVLLTKEQEQVIFNQFNYARYRVTQLKKIVENGPKKKFIMEMLSWDKKARERKALIVELNLRLVVNIAKKHKMYHLDPDEMYSDAHMGLLAAVNGYDATMGYRFSTYAYWSIVRNLGKMNKERSRREEIVVSQIARGDYDNEDSGENELLIDESRTRPEIAFIDKLKVILEKNKAGLSSQELEVLKIRYLGEGKRPSMASTGEKVGLHSHQVAKVEQSALGKMRVAMLERVRK